MNNKFQFIVEESEQGLRIDKLISKHPEVKTRTRAEKLFELKLVQVNQSLVKPSYLVKKNDQVEFEIPVVNSEPILPFAFTLKILFEDDDLIVIDKPAGLVVHPAAGHTNDTLVNALMARNTNLSMGFGENRPGIVHRLDKETSGLLVVAKNDEAHLHLANQFKNKTSHRVYWAVTVGSLKGLSGRIETHLARHPTQRKKICSQKEGKLAITNYEVLEKANSGVCLIKLKLETGRTHQIRVHLSDHGAPVFGDTLYGFKIKSVNADLQKIAASMTRFALHACELGFIHPRTEEYLAFKSTWPLDLMPLVQSCKFKTR